VLSIDVSKTVVNFMQARYEGTAGLAFSQMDVRKMDRLADSCMELVIDKACMDSLFCSGGSYTDVLRMNQEICRVLVPGRHFVSVTLGSPASRLPHLQHQSLLWRVDHCPLRGEGLHGLHVYVCTKSVTLNALQRRISNHKGDVAVGQVRRSETAESGGAAWPSLSVAAREDGGPPGSLRAGSRDRRALETVGLSRPRSLETTVSSRSEPSRPRVPRDQTPPLQGLLRVPCPVSLPHWVAHWLNASKGPASTAGAGKPIRTLAGGEVPSLGGVGRNAGLTRTLGPRDAVRAQLFEF